MKSIWQNPTTINDFKTKAHPTMKRRKLPRSDEGIFEKAQLAPNGEILDTFPLRSQNRQGRQLPAPLTNIVLDV